MGALLPLLAALGCGSLSQTRVIPLTGPVDVRVHEQLLATGRTLELDLRTEQEYGCYNFTIACLRFPLGGADLVKLLGVSVPPTCATAPGPARATLPLGATRLGDRRLRFLVDGSWTTGTMTVSDDSIAVTGGNGPWTRFPLPVLHRVPPGALWGLIGWGPGDESARAQAFLDSLQAAGALPLALAPGDYDYFLVGPDGMPQRQGQDGYWFARPFVVRMPEGRAAVAGVVQAFADSLSISVYGDRGETWFSWLLGPAVGRAAARS